MPVMVSNRSAEGLGRATKPFQNGVEEIGGHGNRHHLSALPAHALEEEEGHSHRHQRRGHHQEAWHGDGLHDGVQP